MRTLLVAVVERISARNVAEVVGVVLAAVLVAMLLGFAGLSFGDFSGWRCRTFLGSEEPFCWPAMSSGAHESDHRYSSR